MNKFAERLKHLRVENSVSHSTLAENLNVSVRSIYYWESGQRECDFNTLIKLADFFTTTTDYLLGRTDYDK